MAKLTKAQLSAASKAGHAAGKPTSQAYKTAFRKKLAQMRGGARSAGRKAKSGAKRAKARASSVAKKTYHRAKSKLSNMTVGQGFETVIALDGLIESARVGYAHGKAYMSGADRNLTLMDGVHILAPAIDAGLAAKAFHTARTSNFTAPLVKTFFNAKPLKVDFGNLLKANLGQIVDAAPSAGGYLLAAKGYLDKSGYFKKTGTPLPRLAGLTGIVVNADMKGVHFDRPAFNATTVPLVAGGVGYKIVHAARTSGLVPAPLKRLGQLHA